MKISLSETEMEIMELFWSSKRKLSFQEIAEHFNERGWKQSTLSTFLKRLTQKNVLSSERNGRSSVYFATKTQQDLKKLRAWNFIKDNFSSITDLVMTLNNDNLSPEEAKKIEAILSKIEEDA